VAGDVKIPVPDGAIPAYRAKPALGRKPPVILVVQEIFGVHEHIKDVCRRLAEARIPRRCARALRAAGKRKRSSPTSNKSSLRSCPRCRIAR